MNFSWIFFISKRYLATKRKEKGISSSVLPILGISIGVMTLTAVLGVMNGFQMSFIESILEISSSHLRIESIKGQSIPERMLTEIKNMEGIKSVDSFISTQTLINTSQEMSSPLGSLVRGVEPNLIKFDEGFSKQIKIVSGNWDITGQSKIILGSEMARILGVGVGETVELMALSGPQFSLLRPEEIQFTITGIFKSGYYPIDSSWCFISLEDSLTHFAKQNDLITGIKLDDYFNDETIKIKIQSLLSKENFEIISWREFNSAFFGALKMEKTVMMLLIGLIFIVVSINIFLSLQRSVWERREDIGLLKAVGAKKSHIQSIFLAEGILIGISGALIGISLGLWAASQVNSILGALESFLNLLNNFIDFLFTKSYSGDSNLNLFSGNAFYIPRIPSRVLFPEVFTVFIFGVLASTAAAWFASWKILKIRPSLVLRAE